MIVAHIHGPRILTEARSGALMRDPCRVYWVCSGDQLCRSSLDLESSPVLVGPALLTYPFDKSTSLHAAIQKLLSASDGHQAHERSDIPWRRYAARAHHRKETTGRGSPWDPARTGDSCQCPCGTSEGGNGACGHRSPLSVGVRSRSPTELGEVNLSWIWSLLLSRAALLVSLLTRD